MARFKTIVFSAIILFAGMDFVQGQMVFVHPGAVNGKAELDTVKAKIAAGEQPWANAFASMKSQAGSNTFTVPPSTENGQKQSARKAYANALTWYYTGDTVYAENAIAILNMWAKKFDGYTPVEGQNLLVAGWIGSLLGPAAEIMRLYPHWDTADMDTLKTMFQSKFYPALNTTSPWNGNVDLTQIDAIMNIAVFCADEEEFKLGIARLRQRNPAYFYLASDGGVPAIDGDGGNADKFWSYPASWVDGLTQETCRDNNHHSQYAMASAFHAAEVAWNQGIDIYGENAERYTAAMELMATQMNTGYMQGTCTKSTPTNDIYATWEIGYNHYHHRMGVDLPHTAQFIRDKVRTRGQSDWNIFYETVTHASLLEDIIIEDEKYIAPAPDISTQLNGAGVFSFFQEPEGYYNSETKKFTVRYLPEGVYTITIYSSSGDIILQTLRVLNDEEFSISFVPSAKGLYIIHYDGTAYNRSFKFIID